MNKRKNKGFTLIELIAVVVIMGIIALIATPNIINLLETGKKSDYASDAKDFVAKAKYMYKLGHTDNFNDDKIYLKDIEGINDYSDPYGGAYDKEKSYVIVSIASNTRTYSIYLVSCEVGISCNSSSQGYHYIGASKSPTNVLGIDKNSVN